MWDTIHTASHLMKRSDFSVSMKIDDGSQPPPFKDPSIALVFLAYLTGAAGFIFIALVG